MRHIRPLLIALFALGILALQHHDARATHDGTGEHIGQVSIDMGPPGTAYGIDDNGRPAVGDRDADGIPDAEGHDTPDPGDAAGTCGNYIDDDRADTDGDTVPGPGGLDGVFDDGCQAVLRVLDICAEIIDDGVLNADEDSIVSGQDRAAIDITVGPHWSDQGEGIPASRRLSGFHYDLNWDVDVLDVVIHDGRFLILASGGARPFFDASDPTPDPGSPFTAEVFDSGPTESGAGVLSRITIEGNAAGVANLELSDVIIQDGFGAFIPVDRRNSAQIAVSSDGPDPGTAIGDAPGEEFHCHPHIDQMSIDVGPPGVANGVEGNGKPAVGDRNGDGIPDAEGYDTPDPADVPGVCGNDLDDDRADFDGDTTPDSPDGIADDGCQVTLTPLESCINIIDDGVLNADEDQLVTGQDRASVDVTLGAHPGPGGGIPETRPMTSWQFDVNWDLDVLDVDFLNLNFLILANGGAAPFSPITTVPDPLSPMTAVVSDAGPPDVGPGVLARLRIEGNAPGIATLRIGGIDFKDPYALPIPVDTFNSARVAVSKDGPDAGTAIGDSAGELFGCGPDADLDGVYDGDEDACAGNARSPTLRPERLDGAFAGVDDDGDTEVDEPLPPGSEAFDCDGDGWIGSWEQAIFSAATTANDQDPCRNTGWPSDLVGSDNRVSIADISSFTIPPRLDGTFSKFNHPVPDPDDPNIGRWDLQQPSNGRIDIADVNRLNPGVTTTMARPPMFGGQQAYFTNGGQCPWPA